ncbi:MAG: hypothetical protein QOH07_3767 [Mycobacterium sp.]|nr:hypothetical protein [Mycobacterium sp.]
MASAVGDLSVANAIAGTTASSFDFASTDGFDSVADSGFNGGFAYASAVGDRVVALASGGEAAPPANFDWASVWGNLSAPTTNVTEAFAGAGLYGLGGSNDVAFVIDPFGTVGSEAMAGLGNNFDLAGALGDNLTAAYTLSDFLFHIAPFF